MKILLPILLVAGFIDANSQIQGKDTQSNVNDLQSGGAMFRSFDNRFKGIVGYPTLTKAYYPGQIILITGVKLSYDSINLDIYSNDLLVKRGNYESVFIRGLVKEFSMKTPGNIRSFTKIRNPKGEDFFYEVLVKGNAKLYKLHKKTITGPTKRDAYSVGETYSTFEETVGLYLQQDDADIVELKNKKVLLSQFPDKEESIVKFMKDNRLDVKKEDEAVKLIELLTLYNKSIKPFQLSNIC